MQTPSTEEVKGRDLFMELLEILAAPRARLQCAAPVSREACITPATHISDEMSVKQRFRVHMDTEAVYTVLSFPISASAACFHVYK
jgi:hypothetical protein